jgi:hypothetical protein
MDAMEKPTPIDEGIDNREDSKMCGGGLKKK